MAGRIRSIKPEILEDERSAGLTSDAWRLWVSMWLLADDHGRLRGMPRWLETTVFWLVKPRETIENMIAELENAALITRYEVHGQKYIEIRNWAKHQRVDHPGKPRVPPPSESSDKENQSDVVESSRDSRESIATHSEPLVKVSETLAPDLRSPTRTNEHESAFDFGAIYEAYPRGNTSSHGKAKGIETLRKTVKTRAAYETVLAAAKRYAVEEAAFKKSGSKAFRPGVPMFSTWVNQRRWEDFETLAPKQDSAPQPLTAAQRIAAREAAERAQ